VTTQSAHPQPAAGPTRPTPAGLSSRALAGRHSAAPGAELAAVHGTYSLDQAGEAIKQLETRAVRGKVLLQVREETGR